MRSVRGFRRVFPLTARQWRSPRLRSRGRKRARRSTTGVPPPPPPPPTHNGPGRSNPFSPRAQTVYAAGIIHGAILLLLSSSSKSGEYCPALRCVQHYITTMTLCIQYVLLSAFPASILSASRKSAAWFPRRTSATGIFSRTNLCLFRTSYTL